MFASSCFRKYIFVTCFQTCSSSTKGLGAESHRLGKWGSIEGRDLLIITKSLKQRQTHRLSVFKWATLRCCALLTKVISRDGLIFRCQLKSLSNSCVYTPVACPTGCLERLKAPCSAALSALDLNFSSACYSANT